MQSYLFGDVGDFLLQALDLHVEVPAAWFLGDGDDVDRPQEHKHTHESWPLPLHGTGGKTIICVTLSSAVAAPQLTSSTDHSWEKADPLEASTPRPSDGTQMA